MNKSTGGPAFPSHGSMGEVAQQGLSLRDFFAAAALIGAIQRQKTPFEQCMAEPIATISYLVADAMLAERDKE